MFHGPSRFLWFSFGSLATLAWMHSHKGDTRANIRVCRPAASQIGYDNDDDGHRGRGQWEREADPARFDEQQQWGLRRSASEPDVVSRFDANGGRRPVAEAGSGRFPADRDLGRLREMSRNAEETISGMSEATIDNMMGGLQRLKDRLAEHRGQHLQDSQKPLATTTPLAAPSEEPPRPRHWV